MTWPTGRCARPARPSRSGGERPGSVVGVIGSSWKTTPLAQTIHRWTAKDGSHRTICLASRTSSARVARRRRSCGLTVSGSWRVSSGGGALGPASASPCRLQGGGSRGSTADARPSRRARARTERGLSRVAEANVPSRSAGPGGQSRPHASFESGAVEALRVRQAVVEVLRLESTTDTRFQARYAQPSASLQIGHTSSCTSSPPRSPLHLDRSRDSRSPRVRSGSSGVRRRTRVDLCFSVCFTFFLGGSNRISVPPEPSAWYL